MARVLVVDDVEDIRFVTAKILSYGGYEPLLAESGRDALAVATQEQIDLILLDISMPDMSGLEVLSTLRRRGVDVPVVMLTALNDPATIREAKKLGATDYIVKGCVDLEAFLADIQRALAQGRPRQELPPERPA